MAEAIPQWKTDIDVLDLSEDKKKRLIELFEYALIQCFPELTEEEVNKMLRLTPLDQTVAGKQIHQRGYDEGYDKGIDKGIDRGELIGEIRMAQRILKQPLTSEKILALKTKRQLKAILKKLEAELGPSLNDRQ